MAGLELLVDESSILKVLQQIIRHCILAEGLTRETGVVEPMTIEDLQGWLETIWDLSVDFRSATFLAKNHGIAVFSKAAARDWLDEANADQACGCARFAESCVGILANMCSHSEVVAEMPMQDVDALQDAVLCCLISIDGPLVCQALRLASALLCSHASQKCCRLWTEAAISQTFFVMESSLLWDAVRHACDVTSQLLVLATPAISDNADPALTGTDAGAWGLGSAAKLLARSSLLAILNVRATELSTILMPNIQGSGAEESVKGHGDVDAALLSVLCLADSFLAVAPVNADTDSAPLAHACVRILGSTASSGVVDASLELLSSLADLTGQTKLASKQSVLDPSISKEVLAIMGGVMGAAVVEKVVMLLAEGEESASSKSETLRMLLQHAPQELVARDKNVLRSTIGE